MLNRRTTIGALLVGGLCAWNAGALAQTDPLPSWNDGAAQQAIVAFPTWGWAVVSMKEDWRTIFAERPQ